MQPVLPGCEAPRRPRPRAIPPRPAVTNRLERACAMLVGVSRTHAGSPFTRRAAAEIMRQYGKAARAALLLEYTGGAQ